jgi:phosphoglycolate phosphatase
VLLGQAGKLEGVRAVVFDLDDTLIDTRGTAYNALCLAASRFSRPQPRHDVFKEVYGDSFEEMAFRWFPDDENVSPKALRTEFVRQGEEIGVSALFDVNSLIQRLKSSGLRVFLWTDSGNTRTESKCISAGIDLKLFDAIVTRESPQGGLKPNPGAITEALRGFGIEPANALMVGNSTTDQYAADISGMHFCGVGHLEPWAKSLSPEAFHRDSAYQIETLLKLGSV